jgi:hypothetical protein
LQQRSQLARPGTGCWATISTEPPAAWRQQLAALSNGATVAAAYNPEELRQCFYAALAAGVRGVVVESPGPLDATDPATKHRAKVLELVNREIELLSPWAASGSLVGTADSSDGGVRGVVLQTDRTRLLLPLANAPASQLALPGLSAAGISFVVPGVPESHNAYLLLPADLRPLAHTRTSGGTRVVLAPGELGPIVFTQDPLVVRELARRIAAGRGRVLQLARALVAEQWRTTTQIEQQLAAHGRAGPASKQLLAQARELLVPSAGTSARVGDPAGYRAVRRAELLLGQVERASWQQAATSAGRPGEQPLAMRYAALPAFWQTQAQASISSPAENRLDAGDFEDLQAAQRAGWRHVQHPLPGLVGEVSFSPEAARSGKLGLRLAVTPQQPAEAPQVVETAPLWIASGPVHVEPGQALHIRGWVKIRRPIAGSVDGLVIADSLGGEALAVRLRETRDWEEFHLVRAAPAAGPVSVILALTGLGEAWIDDVTIQTSAAAPAIAAAPNSSANRGASAQ